MLGISVGEFTHKSLWTGDCYLWVMRNGDLWAVMQGVKVNGEWKYEAVITDVDQETAEGYMKLFKDQ